MRSPEGDLILPNLTGHACDPLAYGPSRDGDANAGVPRDVMDIVEENLRGGFSPGEVTQHIAGLSVDATGAVFFVADGPESGAVRHDDPLPPVSEFERMWGDPGADFRP